MQIVDAGKRKCWRLSAVILSFLSALLLSYSLLVASVFAVCYLTPGYFEHEYEKYDVLSSLPEMTMSKEDGLMAVTDHMMDYLLHGQDPQELQIEVMMDGEMRGFFSEREIAHMEDVRVLFMAAIRFLGFALILIILFMGSSRLLACENEPKIFRISTGIGFVAGGTLVLACFAALGAHIIRHFDQDFITFHHMFFNNDLWILDPSKDMLINIVPEGFFFDTATRIVVYYVVLMLLMIGFGVYLILRGRKMPDHAYSAF